MLQKAQTFTTPAEKYNTAFKRLENAHKIYLEWKEQKENGAVRKRISQTFVELEQKRYTAMEEKLEVCETLLIQAWKEGHEEARHLLNDPRVSDIKIALSTKRSGLT